MHISRRALLASSAGGFALPSLGPALAAVSAPFSAHVADITEALLREMPENATYRGVDTGPRKGLRGELTDRSEAGAAARASTAAERLKRLMAVDRQALSGADAVTYDCALEAHQNAVDGGRFGYGDVTVLSAPWTASNSPYAVTQMTGAFQTIPAFLDNIHPVETLLDAENYLERIIALGEQLDQETARLSADAARGVVPPDFVIDNVLGELRAYLAQPTEGWTLAASLTRRVREKGIGTSYPQVVVILCDKCVRPALQRQVEALVALRARADGREGVWKLPKGEAYYAWSLRCGTTTALSAEAIHQLGVDQVGDIERRMDELLKAQGLTQGSVGARMAALGRDPRFLFANTEAGRTEIVDVLNGRIAAVGPHLARAFNNLPAAKTVVRAVPTEIQDGAPLGYAFDGSADRPATYYINLKDTANWPRFILPTLTFHEAVPGHIWQGACAADLPLIRRLLQFNAYSEGWALYAEQLADELGLYDDDPFGRLGYLQAIQFRACRLVVDTGLHAKRWSRDQALRYLIDHTGRAPGAMQAEVDRYCATPGQACGYKVGHSEINRLRALSQQALGPRFDARRFNDAMVSAGSVPLSALARIVGEDLAAAAPPRLP